LVDIGIGAAFLLAALSGIVLLAAGPSGGYQGGRNPAYGANILLLSRPTWKTLHDWSGIAMTAGVGVHMLLHWGWFVCMTRNLFRRRRSRTAVQCSS
jgi:hypothetical protein